MAAILNFQNGGHEVCVKALFHVLLLYIHVLDVYAYDFDVKDSFATTLKTNKQNLPHLEFKKKHVYKNYKAF